MLSISVSKEMEFLGMPGCPASSRNTRVVRTTMRVNQLAALIAQDSSGDTDLCKLPVLFLLPNRLFPEFFDCTAFIGLFGVPPNNVHVGNGKLDIRGIPVLNSQLDDFSFLLDGTPIVLDDLKTTRCRNNDAF